MEDKFYQPNYGDDDVITFNSSEMCKFGRFKQVLQSALQSKLPDTLVEYLEAQGITGTSIREYQKGSFRVENYNRKWFIDGKNCEILSIGAGGWQKGKLRIKFTLEFCPDEPEVEELTQSNDVEINQTESPLDDIRQLMSKDTQ
ncbi:KGK domain-containing protein [Chlorogloea sp. CCALA 695]|uniref:KGK domain-containing protein n=1 Tax=Chlorogloea sp. CCALA 695 TaxID=2107693 RepID=UPI000D051B64|nr:KGK domain-containing protein [Chlorogloea sp. CCALA 695]PSB35065.1 hypothetical protein C7B70_02075 [Chlorogloea sp. CCALA 695]